MSAAVAAPPLVAATRELARGIAALGLPLDGVQQDQLMRYVALLHKWNRVYNLTAVREIERMVSHHLIDSLAILPYVDGTNVLDVGTGAGLPGIPLAIARPHLSVTLLDSIQKKTAFLQQAIGELGLKNASVVCNRVELWKPPQRFDVIVSRAFAELADFVNQSAHLLAPGGVFLAMKGVHPVDEIKRLPAGFILQKVVRLDVPGLGAERHLVFIEAEHTA